MKIFTRRNGKKVALLNPQEKRTKFFADLKEKNAINPVDGSRKPLTPTGASYRIGYLAAQKDSANCWKAKNGIKNPRRMSKSSKKNVVSVIE